MKNKRGILLASETLKIVLSVIAIAILAYLLFALYHANASSEKLEHAKATMEKISQTINQLKLNSSYPGNISQITPIGWSIFSFIGQEKPNSCADLNCLCICDSIIEIGLIDRTQQKECDSDGTCLIIQNLKEFEEIKIGEADDPTSIEIFKSGSWIGVRKI